MNEELFFSYIDRFFDRIKQMHVVKVFLLAWVINLFWMIIVGGTLFLLGVEFSQHVASSNEFTNSFLLLPFAGFSEEVLFRWGPALAVSVILTYLYRSGQLSKEKFFYVERYALLFLVVVSSIIFGWVHGNIFNVLIQGFSGAIMFIIYLRCFFIERDLGVRDRWQVVPFFEAGLYHTMANAFLIFI